MHAALDLGARIQTRAPMDWRVQDRPHVHRNARHDSVQDWTSLLVG
jgi:hypothetical protein